MKTVLELADAVRQAPDDADLRAVFADALLEQKDPAWTAMGELVVASRGTTPELARRARELAQAIRATGKLPSKHFVRFTFDHGLIRRATPGQRAFKVPAIEELFRRPELSVLSELDLRCAWPTGARARAELVRGLGRIVPPHVRWLGLGPGVDVAALLDELPSLTGLGLFADEAAPLLDVVAGAERITDLELAAGDFGSAMLARLATLPLRRLVIYADGYTPGPRELDPFLTSTTLESLGFMTANGRRAIAFLEALFASPLFERLRSFGVALNDAEPVREWLTGERARWADKVIFTGPSSPLVDPDWEETWDELGSLLADVERHAEALPLREDLVFIDPKLAWYWDNLGDSRQALGDLDFALAAYERAIKIDDDLASAWRSKADVLDDLERPDEALSAWTRAVELEPKDAYSHDGLAGALAALGRHDEALVAYATAWRYDKTFFHAPSNRGDVNLSLGRFDDAFADYERCLKPGDGKTEEYAADPELVHGALAGIAFIWKARGELGKARDYLLRAQKLARDSQLDDGVGSSLVAIAVAEGNLTEALAIADGIGAAADDTDGHVRAWLLLELGRLEDAAAAFAAIPDSPSDVERAFLLEGGGNEPEALALLEKDETRAPDDVYCAYHALARLLARGVLLARAGRSAEATVCFRAVRPAPIEPEALRDALARAAGSPPRDSCDGEWCLGAVAAAAIVASVLDGATDEAHARADALGATLETLDPTERCCPAFDLRRLARLASLDGDALVSRTLDVVEGNALPRTLRKARKR